MANTVAEMSVKISADVTNMKAGLREATRATQDFGAKSKAALRSVSTPASRALTRTPAASEINPIFGPAGTSMGGRQKLPMAAMAASSLATSLSAAAIAGATLFGGKMLAGFVYNTARAVEQTTELSRALGASVSGMQSLEYAGTIAGVAVEDLQQNMSMLTRRIGSGDAAKGLRRLGLDAEALKNTGADDAMMQIITAMGGVSNESTRAAIAMEIFGRGGLKMMKLAAEGGAKLAVLTDEAKRLGLVTGSDTAKGFDSLTDDIDRMKAGAKGAAIAFVSALMPAFKAASSGIAELSKAFNWYISVLTYRFPPAADRGKSAFDAMIEKQRELAREAVNTGKITADEFEKLNAKLDARSKAGPDGGAPSKATEAAADAAEEDEKAWKDKVRRAREIEASTRSEFQKRKDEIMEVRRLESEGLLKRGTGDAMQKAMENEPRKTEEARMRAEASAMMAANATPAEKYKEALDSLNRLFGVGMLSVEDYNRQLSAISKTYTEQQFGKEMQAFSQDQARAKGLAESTASPQEIAAKNIAEAQELYAKGLIDDQTMARIMSREQNAMMPGGALGMEAELDTKERSNIDAISSNDIMGQVGKGRLGGAQDLAREQLNTQKRMAQYLAVMAQSQRVGMVPSYGV